MTDGLAIKEKIISIIKTTGPSLPVFIARETGLSILFASAFLSELIADKRLKTSNMHVGSSPLYLIPGQEPMLENFSQHLKNKEKEAFVVLKEKKFLVDKELEPAIRVALRTIKDFAFPFQRDNEILWRYFLVPETEFNLNLQKPKEEEKIEIIKQEEKPEIVEEVVTEIIEDKKPKKKDTKKILKKTKHATQKGKEDHNKFFTKVKEFLAQKKIEIIDIEEVGINRIIFRVKEKEEYLIIAYNKKKIEESDIIISHKKSQEFRLPYKILMFGEPLKKIDSLISAVKDLKGIEKVG